PVLDARGDVHRQRALARDAPRPAAGDTRIVDHLAAAVTVRTGALEREEALRLADLAVPLAHRAGLRLGAGLGAGAGADFAGDRGRNAHLRGLAGERLLERDLHVKAQVVAALAPAAAALPSAHAEEVVENIGEGRGEIGAE